MLSSKAKLAFHNLFRSALTYSIADAEDFQEVLYVIGRLSTALTKMVRVLVVMNNEVQKPAEESTLAFDISKKLQYLPHPLEKLCLMNLTKTFYQF